MNTDNKKGLRLLKFILLPKWEVPIIGMSEPRKQKVSAWEDSLLVCTRPFSSACHFILTAILYGRYYYYFNFSDEVIGPQRDEGSCLSFLSYWVAESRVELFLLSYSGYPRASWGRKCWTSPSLYRKQPVSVHEWGSFSIFWALT